MSKPATLLILYSEVMPYNVICFQDFVESTGGSIHVISWNKSKKLTPYQAPPFKGITYHEKPEFDAKRIKLLIAEIGPSVLYVVGRMEPDYLEACVFARMRGIPVIGTYDNHFTGSWKQRLMKTFSRRLFKRYFDWMMVPGLYQYEFMRFIGYRRNRILFPQYCADTRLFSSFYEQQGVARKEKKYLLFVGRLHIIKGVNILAEAFRELKESGETNLQLIIVGNGPLKNTFTGHKDIILHDFLDQKEIIKLLPEVKFVCFPSLDEAWGLVIHEFTAAGLPVITTEVCGAATAFVKNGYNGILVPPADKGRLKKAILQMDRLSSEELETYGRRSNELSKQISPAMWTSAINSVIDR